MKKKQIAFSKESLDFFACLPKPIRRQFKMICQKLETDGFLVAPFAEKVEGYRNLFAIRIISRSNIRCFYCYVVDSERIWILNGYEKKTQKIPQKELQRALSIRKRLEAENG